MDRPIKERRKHLHDHMKEVGNHVKFSEMKIITKKQELGDMIKKVLKQGLEGKREVGITIYSTGSSSSRYEKTLCDFF